MLKLQYLPIDDLDQSIIIFLKKTNKKSVIRLLLKSDLGLFCLHSDMLSCLSNLILELNPFCPENGACLLRPLHIINCIPDDFHYRSKNYEPWSGLGVYCLEDRLPKYVISI